MKTTFTFSSALALFAGLASVANAHTYLSKLNIAGTQYDEGVCIRPYPSNRNFPVKDPSSSDMTCGVGGLSSTAAKTCPVAAGSKITVEWHHDNASDSDDVIDITHMGPCLVYMAPLSSNGKGDVWFKVFEDGYDASSNQWCVNKIRANHGKLDITIPSDIKAGDYLLRTEVIALHESDTDYASNSARGSQYYPNCAQVSVTGSGAAVPVGHAIPGIYKTNSPGIIFDLYSSYNSYPIPGPAVYVAGSAAPAPVVSSSSETEYTTTTAAAVTTTAATTTSSSVESYSATTSTTVTSAVQSYATTSTTESSSVEIYSNTIAQTPAAPISSAPGSHHSTVTVYVNKCH
ncbi:hypothetical protein LPJ66_000838 [Kickxella alabastrina]|uniref:Uncharacterized protein n=1 Tax=Kickxella alabastrina TaxID=61397 RepID=A0ACC1IV06_9FUNG|nr:hypothetical protein LPJ66_000838 [Kickxella alabastrina]